MSFLVFLWVSTTFHGCCVRSSIIPNNVQFSPENSGKRNFSEDKTSLPTVHLKTLSNLTLYKGPLPRLPGSTASPFVALHSPVKMFIPIRYSDSSAADSPGCVRCPRNLVAVLRRGQGRIQTPVPTISICPSFASRPGRVHVAVVSGPRPGQRLDMGRHRVELVVWKAGGPVHSCRFIITVTGRSRDQAIPKKEHPPCQRPEAPRDGILVCHQHSKASQVAHGTVCQLLCPGRHREAAVDSATSVCRDGHWSPRWNLSCLVPKPVLKEGCEDIQIASPGPEADIEVPLPSFHSDRPVNVSCSPARIRTAGQQRVQCRTDEGNVSCSFTVTAVAKEDGREKTSAFSKAGRRESGEGAHDVQESMAANTSLGTLTEVGQPTRLTTETPPQSSTETSATAASAYATAAHPSPVPSTLRVSPTDIAQPSAPENATESTGPTEMTSGVNATTTVETTRGLDAFSVSAEEAASTVLGIVATPESEENGTCAVLEPPANGSLSCRREGRSQRCVLTCDPGFGLAGRTDAPLLSCQDGLWDNDSDGLPPCLAQVESSSAQVWMGFEAEAPNCDDQRKEDVQELVLSLCPPDARCQDSVSVNCTLDEEEDIVLLSVGWTVQVDLDEPSEDEEGEVPEAELRLESALESARAFIAAGDIPGLRLSRDSFRRGRITLVCPDGFTADMLAANCIKCPSVSENTNEECPPCGCI